MEKLKSFPCLALVFSLVSTVMMVQVDSQSITICSRAMTRSFSPCLNYLTSSSSSASSPTEACCTSLKNLMSNGQDCLCLIVTGGVLFQIPFNRALALSLPRACKMAGVPVECKGTPSSPTLSLELHHTKLDMGFFYFFPHCSHFQPYLSTRYTSR